jgi:hypothetical protein
MTPKSPPEVEQSDRDAAYKYLCSICQYADAEDARNARADRKPLVQAFAAHRIAALAKVTDERDRLRAAAQCACSYDDPSDVCEFHRKRNADEREKVVAWLKQYSDDLMHDDQNYESLAVLLCADAIARGDHISPQAGEGE